jgi:hypothetical protein
MLVWKASGLWRLCKSSYMNLYNAVSYNLSIFLLYPVPETQYCSCRGTEPDQCLTDTFTFGWDGLSDFFFSWNFRQGWYNQGVSELFQHCYKLLQSRHTIHTGTVSKYVRCEFLWGWGGDVPIRLVGSCQCFGETYSPHLQVWSGVAGKWNLPASPYGGKT